MKIACSSGIRLKSAHQAVAKNSVSSSGGTSLGEDDVDLSASRTKDDLRNHRSPGVKRDASHTNENAEAEGSRVRH